MSNIKDVPKVSYCTPDDVAEALDLPDPHDLNGRLTFSNISHPSYDQVCRMIASNEGQIDKLLRRTWRENVNAQDGQVLTLNSYWHDINGWRADYYAEGGDYIQLRKDMRHWDPFPKYEYAMADGEIQTENALDDDGNQIYIDINDPQHIMDDGFFWTKARKQNGDLICTDKGVQTFVLVASVATGEGPLLAVTTPVIDKTLYGGDRLEVRMRTNVWRDISYSPIGEIDDDGTCWNVWFDYPYGKAYIKTRLFQQKYNAVRIRYRYGSEEPVPDAIVRMCAVMTAINVINMQFFNVKLGTGGDLGNTRQEAIDRWTKEIDSIKSSYQRSGSVHSMLR